MIENNISYEKFLQSRGHRVIHSDELWYNVRPFIYQTANYFVAKPTKSELVYRNFPAIACRWFEQSKSVEEADTILYLCKPPYNLEMLSKKARNQTKRGLENFLISSIKPEDRYFSILEDIYIDNLSRLRLLRNDKNRRKAWKNWWKTIKDVRDLELWVAEHNNVIGAFVITTKKGGGVEIVLERSSSVSLPFYPNNALIYSLTKTSFENGAEYVSYGLEQFVQKKNSVTLSHFKLGMGYTPNYLKERYSLNPLFSWLFPEKFFNQLVNLYKRGIHSQ